MSDVELVIKIPEEVRNRLSFGVTYSQDIQTICEAIGNSTPLPKGHGRIGDLDKIKKEMQDYHDDCAKTSEYTRLGFETAIAVVEDAQPIIEADKDSEGKQMRDIHCPKDIGLENTFINEDCQKEQFYNNCYHCWTTALAKGKVQHWVMPVQNDRRNKDECEADKEGAEKADR